MLCPSGTRSEQLRCAEEPRHAVDAWMSTPGRGTGCSWPSRQNPVGPRAAAVPEGLWDPTASREVPGLSPLPLNVAELRAQGVRRAAPCPFRQLRGCTYLLVPRCPPASPGWGGSSATHNREQAVGGGATAPGDTFRWEGQDVGAWDEGTARGQSGGSSPSPVGLAALRGQQVPPAAWWHWGRARV